MQLEYRLVVKNKDRRVRYRKARDRDHALKLLTDSESDRARTVNNMEARGFVSATFYKNYEFGIEVRDVSPWREAEVSE